MGLRDTLSRLLAAEEEITPRNATAALMEAYIECVRRAAQLARHAELAPQDYSAQALKQLAAADAEQGERLGQAITVAGAPLPPVTEEPLPADALNHWGRLVQDLEAHRRCVVQSRELAQRFASQLPQTAALFESLWRAESSHCLDLRALIARADPLALN